MKRLLIVVDMQNDFITGPLGTKEAVGIVPFVMRLIRSAEKNGIDVIFTQDTHGDDYLSTQEGMRLPVPHCIEDTDGWAIYPEIARQTEGAWVFRKSTFAGISLAEHVRDVYDEITLCGVCTDICVISNALMLKAFCPETIIRVVADACAGTTVKKHRAALAVMQSCQIVID